MTDLWLGAEYNANYPVHESTDALMKQYIETRFVKKNISFFERLETQVEVFGDPRQFHYDDVSRVKATGKHTEKERYEDNVVKSIDHHITLFADLKPRLILIGGSLAFDAYKRLVLPNLDYENLVIVKLRNPSPQAHRGSKRVWNSKYKNFTADLSGYSGLSLLHLACPDIESNFEIRELAKKYYE